MRAEARMKAAPPKKPEPVSTVAKQPEAAPADANAAPPPPVRLRMQCGCPRCCGFCRSNAVAAPVD
jgi:hypothetical protein